MSESDSSCLSLIVGGRSVADNLDRAVATSRITLRPDGRYTLPDSQMQAGGVGLADPYIFRSHGTPHPCVFFTDFLFNHAYAGAAVPWGCRNCYKMPRRNSPMSPKPASSAVVRTWS